MKQIFSIHTILVGSFEFKAYSFVLIFPTLRSFLRFNVGHVWISPKL